MTDYQSFRRSASPFMDTSFDSSRSSNGTPDMSSASASYFTAHSPEPVSKTKDILPLFASSNSLTHSKSRSLPLNDNPDVSLASRKARGESMQSLPVDEDVTISGRATPTAFACSASERPSPDDWSANHTARENSQSPPWASPTLTQRHPYASTQHALYPPSPPTRSLSPMAPSDDSSHSNSTAATSEVHTPTPASRAPQSTKSSQLDRHPYPTHSQIQSQSYLSFHRSESSLLQPDLGRSTTTLGPPREEAPTLDLPTFSLDIDFGSSFETTFDLGLDNFGSAIKLPSVRENGVDEEEEEDTMAYSDSLSLSTTVIPLPDERPEGVGVPLPESRPMSSLSMMIDEHDQPRSSTPKPAFSRGHQANSSSGSGRSMGFNQTTSHSRRDSNASAVSSISYMQRQQSHSDLDLSSSSGNRSSNLSPTLNSSATSLTPGSAAIRRSLSNLNKSLPPTPRKQPIRADTQPPPMPQQTQQSHSRTNSMRKTAMSAAVAKFTKSGKSLMSRTSSSNLLDQHKSEQSKGIANPLYQHQQQQYHPQPETPSPPAGCMPAFNGRNSSHIAIGSERERARSISHPPVMDLQSEDTSRISKRSTASSAATVHAAPPQPRPSKRPEPPRESHARKYSAVPPEPADPDEADRRPTTERLLMLASEKLAKLAILQTDSSAVSERSSLSLRSTSSFDLGAETADDEVDEDDVDDTAVTLAVRVNRNRAGTLEGPSAESTLVHNIQRDSMPVAAASPKAVRTSVPILVAQRKLENAATDLPTATSEARTPLTPAPPARKMTPPPPQLVWKKRSYPSDSGVGSDTARSAAWIQLEDALQAYLQALSIAQPDRFNIIQTVLLVFLRRADLGQERLAADRSQAARQRQILFSWLDVLAGELKNAPSNRGACLDGVAGILESVCLSGEILAHDPAAEERFRDSLIAILSFAVDKLNEKAVYANTLSFSGRLLAIAFFRIEGVGEKLLRLLPQVKRQDLKRVLEEIHVTASRSPPPQRPDIFPEHLNHLCYKNLHTYSNLLSPLAPSDTSYLIQSNEHAIRMNGNWLIRWQASDSDLPFAFYRAYHRQLAAYLHPPNDLQGQPEAFVSPFEAVSAPGFLFLAASLLEKVDSLIHRNLRSVTTLGPNNNNLNTQESANLSMAAKPKVLEHANRRVVSTILDIVGGPARPIANPEADTFEGLSRRRFFGGMLQVWLRAVVKRTSLFDARGIFLLLDFIEGLFYTVCTHIPSPNQEMVVWRPALNALDMFDTNFILSFVHTIFSKADNTVALMRTITFIYSQFETFTLRPDDREQLCMNVLLNPETFRRLFLFWNTSVRGYFVRLIVWKLSRLGTANDGRPMDIKDSQIVYTLQAFNAQLESIRTRYNELDPLDDLPDDDLFDSHRSSIDSTRGVADQPWTIDELLEGVTGNQSSGDISPSSDDEGADPWHAHNGHHTDADGKSRKGKPKMSKMVNWFKDNLQPGKVTQQAAKKSPRNRRDLPEMATYPYTLPSGAEVHSVHLPQSTSSDTTPSSSNLTISNAGTAKDKKPRASSPTLLEAEDQSSDNTFPYKPSSPGPDRSDFYHFEFENGMPKMEGRKSKRGSLRSNRTSIVNGATPRRPNSVTPSPRVSKRFSKRQSLLPPAALDLLAESHEPVPQIPKHFRQLPPYPQHQHPYAIRGLREYEESLDEYAVWTARVKEDDDEELEGRDEGELIPRLAVQWPLSFSED